MRADGRGESDATRRSEDILGLRTLATDSAEDRDCARRRAGKRRRARVGVLDARVFDRGIRGR